VYVNELYSHSLPPDVDKVELHNPNSTSADISGRDLIFPGAPEIILATWLILGALMLSNPRTSSTGFASAHVSAWTYLLNQTVMITRYLWLTVWPKSLVLYYGWSMPITLREALPNVVFLVALFALAVFALVRWPRAGFLGAWFFATPAGTSNVQLIPVAMMGCPSFPFEGLAGRARVLVG
jgi:hypothetical protein